MTARIIAAAALALSLTSGIAIAQSSDGGSGAASNQGANVTESGGADRFASDDERMMYEENAAMFGPFFTDDTMSTARSNDEIGETFAAMGADDQASMKAACERAMENRGSYGTVTVALCEQIGAM